MGLSKNRGILPPKMDGEKKWKTLWTNGWFGCTPIFGNTHIPSPKETSFPTISFHVQTLSLRKGNSWKPENTQIFWSATQMLWDINRVNHYPNPNRPTINQVPLLPRRIGFFSTLPSPLGIFNVDASVFPWQNMMFLPYTKGCEHICTGCLLLWFFPERLFFFAGFKIKLEHPHYILLSFKKNHAGRTLELELNSNKIILKKIQSKSITPTCFT